MTSKSAQNVVTLDNLPGSTGSSLVGFMQSGTGATARTVQAKERDIVSIKDFGAAVDGATTDTSAWTTGVAAAIAGNFALYQPAGISMATVSVRGSNVGIYGAGSSVSTIKHPNTTLANVLELGDTASGNGATAYSKITVHGLTLDGNRSVVAAPSSDVVGHGLPLTKISNFHISDVRAVNCHNAGFGAFINSNYGYADVYVENCGNATHTGPGFDINSSKYGIFKVVSKDCYVGGRVLDNCFGNNVAINVQNATSHGFVYNNQAVNESYGNNIDATVITCGGTGFLVGLKCRSGNIRAAVYSAAASGMEIQNDGTSANKSRNLNIDLSTENCTGAGLLCYGDDCIIRHQTYLDGRGGAQGSYYAVDIYGNRNKLTVDLIDSSTWQVRGIAFRAGATDNEVVSYSFTNTADPLNDSGTRTKVNHGHGRGADIASASTITIPIMGSLFHVTGTTGITTMAGFGQKDQVITLIFEDTLTVTDGSNLKLNGNFSATADDTLTGLWDGTNFYEIARSNN